MSEIKFVIFLLWIGIYSCDIDRDVELATTLDLVITDSRNAQTPNLWIDNEILHLTWTKEKGDTTSLYYTHIEGDKQYTSQVAWGTDWFVNWADFSSITADAKKPNNVLTHWLQKSAEGTYDYDIKISKSLNSGVDWSEPYTLHSDGVAAEHGFVSVIDYNKTNFFATWLDGRNTKTDDPINKDKFLPMSLRAGLIHKNSNNSITEYLIDEKVCDCCQTSCTKTQDGVLIAYRDRTDEEIRDITVRRFAPEGSKVIFRSNDNWKINGCPVNGPAITSDSTWNTLVWYSAADSASVFLAYGENDRFDKKLKIDNGNPLGRVDVEIANNKAYVTWLEMTDQRAEIRMKTIHLPTTSVIEDQLIAYTSAERRSGFPILKLSSKYAYITYTEVLSADHTTIRLKQITI